MKAKIQKGAAQGAEESATEHATIKEDTPSTPTASPIALLTECLHRLNNGGETAEDVALAVELEEFTNRTIEHYFKNGGLEFDLDISDELKPVNDRLDKIESQLQPGCAEKKGAA